MQIEAKVITLDGKHGADGTYHATLSLLCGRGINAKSMIDLCCNEATHTRRLPFREKVYVDILPRLIGPEQSMFVQADVLAEHAVFNRHYDVSLCLDGIEHVTKEQGHKLIERMKKISDRQVLFTPLHPWMMEPNNPSPESHKSLWGPADLPDWGHIVIPEYHKSLGIGAFFFWNCPNLDDDFEKVKKGLEVIW